ncbi:MAG: hypothetical protein R3E10_14610 [Gemmatimonadota bacterium]
MVLLHLLLVLIVGPPAATEGQAPLQAAPGVAVIVHEDVPVASVDASEVRRLFLLRQRFWADRVPVTPVNLPATSAVRERFSRVYLRSSTQALSAYFKDLYFHGTRPPQVLESEEAVALYVARTPGAVGYVSVRFLAAGLPAGVRVVHETAPVEGGN